MFREKPHWSILLLPKMPAAAPLSLLLRVGEGDIFCAPLPPGPMTTPSWKAAALLDESDLPVCEEKLPSLPHELQCPHLFVGESG